MKNSELQQLLDEILEQGESVEFVEFKHNDKSKFGEYIAALSNAACLRNKEFGYLIFGVEDETKKIIGTQVKKGDLVRASISAGLNPKIDYSVFNFEYQNKPIILVRISAAKGQPTYFRGKDYVRIGEDKTGLQNLTLQQIKKIYNSGVDWSAQIAEGATISDLDEEAIKKAKIKFKERRENAKYLNEVDKWSVANFLNKAEILANGKVTNAALLLLGKRESRHLLNNSANSAEITWSLETQEEQTYEHFYPPFLTAPSEFWQRIRNTKYKLFPANELLAREVNKYDEEVILEAIYNCIAHQDYFENSRILVVEKADRLIFKNAGNFFEGEAEEYALGEKKALKYRNPFLVSAMVNLGMIDKMGYGIRKMFLDQRKRFFPLPDYSKSNNDFVNLEIYGRVIDEKFSQILIERDLDFATTVLLDRVQKKLQINDEEAKLLRKQRLIEGRKPNYFVTAEIALVTNQKAKHIKNRAFDKKWYKDLVLQLLEKYEEASRREVDELLMEKLPDILSVEQKKKKIENILQEMARSGTIKNYGSPRVPRWRKKLGEN